MKNNLNIKNFIPPCGKVYDNEFIETYYNYIYIIEYIQTKFDNIGVLKTTDKKQSLFNHQKGYELYQYTSPEQLDFYNSVSKMKITMENCDDIAEEFFYIVKKFYDFCEYIKSVGMVDYSKLIYSTIRTKKESDSVSKIEFDIIKSKFITDYYVEFTISVRFIENRIKLLKNIQPSLMEQIVGQSLQEKEDEFEDIIQIKKWYNQEYSDIECDSFSFNLKNIKAMGYQKNSPMHMYIVKTFKDIYNSVISNFNTIMDDIDQLYFGHLITNDWKEVFHNGIWLPKRKKGTD